MMSNCMSTSPLQTDEDEELNKEEVKKVEDTVEDLLSMKDREMLKKNLVTIVSENLRYKKKVRILSKDKQRKKNSFRLVSILKPRKHMDHNYSLPLPAVVKKENKATQTFAHVSIQCQDRNYSEDEIKDATLLMYSSQKTYELLRSFGRGRYPSQRTVQRHIQNFQCYYGFNDEMFLLLGQKMKTLPETHRNLSLVFDEIDIQPTTNYSIKFKERIPKAKKALVVMVRGLLAPFKEVIYYNFDTILERERGKSSMDLQLLNQLIARVEEAGGSVRSVTMDMGNKTLLSNCGVNI